MSPDQINKQKFDRLRQVDKLMSQLSRMHKFFETEATQKQTILDKIKEKQLSKEQETVKLLLEQMFQIYEIGDYMQCVEIMGQIDAVISNSHKVVISPPPDVTAG